MSTVIGLVSAGVQSSQGGAQASIAKGQGEIDAQQEELGAKQRESDRKERLAIALSSQNARAGAGGVAAFEGSPLTVMNEDIRREETATSRDAFQTQLKAMTLRAGGKIQSQSLRTGSLLNLAGSASEFIGKQSKGSE